MKMPVYITRTGMPSYCGANVLDIVLLPKERSTSSIENNIAEGLGSSGMVYIPAPLVALLPTNWKESVQKLIKYPIKVYRTSLGHLYVASYDRDPSISLVESFQELEDKLDHALECNSKIGWEVTYSLSRSSGFVYSSFSSSKGCPCPFIVPAGSPSYAFGCSTEAMLSQESPYGGFPMTKKAIRQEIQMSTLFMYALYKCSKKMENDVFYGVSKEMRENRFDIYRVDTNQLSNYVQITDQQKLSLSYVTFMPHIRNHNYGHSGAWCITGSNPSNVMASVIHK